MSKILVAYYSRTGTTKKMAELIGAAIKKECADVSVKAVQEIKADELALYDAIAVGTPTYYGSMAAEIKQLFDDSVKIHGKLDGRIGAAFSSSVNIGGGNETAILDILNAMLIHGMIIHGDPQGDHYGPVSVGAPDDRVAKQCARFGQRLAALTKRLRP